MDNLLQGNVLERIKDIPTKSIQCVVTSPPYWGLRDYGTARWNGGSEECDHKPEFKVSSSTTVGSDIKDVGKKYYRNICRKCGAKRVDEQLGLESTPQEYVYNMVNVFREVKRVLKSDGTLWLNIGDSYASSGQFGKPGEQNIGPKSLSHGRAPTPAGLKVKDLVGIPWRLAFALQEDDWYLRQDIIWAKGNPTPESVKDRCTKSHEYIFLMTKSAKYYYDYKAIAEKSIHFESDNRSKLGRVPHKSGKSILPDSQYAFNGVGYSEDGMKNKRSVWNINTKPYSEAHFAVFPEKIPELCIKAGSKVGDTVLDPFFGSGTTGYVAQRLDRKWVGIELNPEYIKIAEQRFRQQELFAPHGSEMEEIDYITYHDPGDENDKRNN